MSRRSRAAAAPPPRTACAPPAGRASPSASGPTLHRQHRPRQRGKDGFVGDPAGGRLQQSSVKYHPASSVSVNSTKAPVTKRKVSRSSASRGSAVGCPRPRRDGRPVRCIIQAWGYGRAQQPVGCKAQRPVQRQPGRRQRRVGRAGKDQRQQHRGHPQPRQRPAGAQLGIQPRLDRIDRQHQPRRDRQGERKTQSAPARRLRTPPPAPARAAARCRASATRRRSGPAGPLRRPARRSPPQRPARAPPSTRG